MEQPANCWNLACPTNGPTSVLQISISMNRIMDLNNIPGLNEFLERLLKEESTDEEYFKNFAMKLTGELPKFAAKIPVFGDDKQAYLVWDIGAHNQVTEINGDLKVEIEYKEPTLDLTGSPLQCSFILNESPDKDILTHEKTLNTKVATTVENARIIVSAYCQIVSRMTYEPHAIWVLCDGSDNQRTLAFGAKKIKGEISRRVVTYSWHSFVTQLPTMEFIKNTHLRCLSQNCKIKSKGLAVYNMASAGECSEVNSLGNSSEVMCTWGDVKEVLENPGKDAEYIMSLSICLGDPRSELHSKYKELCLLESFANSLETMEISWVPQENESTALEQISNLLEDISVRKLHVSKASAKNPDLIDVVDLETILDDLSVGSRKNMEFFDMLWLILKGCSSYKELVDCLTLVMKAIQGGTVRPLIRNKSTELWQFLHKILSNPNEEIPTFDELFPLKALVEIGVEKIKQDYINAFVEAGIVTKDTLSYFVSEKLGFGETMNCLYKLQCAAELLAPLKSFVEPPQTLIQTFVRKALGILEKSDWFNGPHIFQFPLDRYIVQQLIRTHDSDRKLLWQLELSSHEGTYSVNTKWNICKTIPSDIGWICSPLDSTDEMTSVPGRCCIVNTEIRDIIF